METTDPFSSEHLDDPYPLYQSLRDRAEDLVESKERGLLIASRYDVVRSILRDHRTWRSSLGTQWVSVADSGVPAAVFIETDPPDHTRIRRAAQPFFVRSAAEALAPMVEEVTLPLIERFVRKGGGDAMEEIARHVPVGVMGRWLGVDLPPELTQWADASFRLGAPDPPPDSAGKMRAFFKWALTDGGLLREHVRPGGLAEEILDGGMGEGLQDGEIPIALISILIAGLDTTVHLIGNGLHALAAHPEQFEHLRGDPSGQARATVDESLRFESPVRFFLRRSDEGRTVALLFGSANRDERVFHDPATFSIERDASNHLAFGFGAHKCLGEPLALLEGTVVFRAIAEHATSLRVAEGAKRTDSRAIRGFATLPLIATRR